jgi:hypothetical protein
LKPEDVKSVTTQARGESMSSARQIFLLCAREDESLRINLEKHLSPFVRSGRAVLWHSGKVLPGDDPTLVIEAHLSAVDVVLVLVTADFLASTTLYDEQLQKALARRERDGVRVVPIVAKPCAWTASALANLEPLPKSRTPIMLYPHPDEAWAEVADGVINVLSQVSAELMVKELKSDIKKIDSFIEEDESETRISDLVGDTLDHPRDTWSKLLIMRAVLRRLLRKIADAHGMRYNEFASLTQMIEDFKGISIIEANLARDIERIRDATFTAEWGAGRPPEPGELQFALDNYQRVFEILKATGALRR